MAKLGVPANTVSVVGVEKQVVAGVPLVAAVPALRAGNGSPATALQQRYFGSKAPCLLCPRGSRLCLPDRAVQQTGRHVCPAMRSRVGPALAGTVIGTTHI